MATTAETITARANGAFVDVDGVRTYYETTGTGDALVLLHGGLVPVETFDAMVPGLAEHYTVYTPERFGHGRTRDIDGPITYENMAAHTIGFIDALGLENVNIGGWSDGALVSLLVALRRPKLVRKLVFLESFVTVAGAPGFYHEMMTHMASAADAPPFAIELYNALSPDGPEHFPVLFDKLRAIWTIETGIDIADLKHVTAPTLLLLADQGSMTYDHIAEVTAALPDWQLAIVPGTSHGLPMEKPHIVDALIVDFLADDQVEKMF